MSLILLMSLHKYFGIREFNYNKEIITRKSIVSFDFSEKKNNDKNNKIRESIIGAIINGKVPEEFYIVNEWLLLQKAVLNYLTLVTSGKPYKKIKLKHMGGRKYNYDFEINVDFEDGIQDKFVLELKFNAGTIEQTPQFVSPMKPSKYLSESYEEFFYENFLPVLANASNLPMPSKTEYVKEIHGPKPKCMLKYQELYYQGCSKSSKFTNKVEDIAFYELAKKVSNDSISCFIERADLKIEKLSDYLSESQKGKNYMLYYKKKFVLQQVNMDDYKICSVEKNPNKFRFECETKSGKKMNVLLRFKNGNGIAFPSFQIN